MNVPYTISIKDLERPYLSKKKEAKYLKSISLNVASGEIFGVIGRADSGKTALLRTISLIERPTTGIVAIENHNMTVMSGTELKLIRKKIALISHNFGLLSSKSAYDNVALPLILQSTPKDEIYSVVTSALSSVGLSDKASCNITQLNQAQKLKVAIARALILKPKVLLFDDIARGLDQKSTQSIINLIRELHKKLEFTAILVTNDSEMLKMLTNRIGVMHQGELIEVAKTVDLFINPQTEVSKDFIKANAKHELPLIFRRRLLNQPSPDSHPIVRFSFTGCLVPEVHLSQVIQNYDLKISIIQGHQETIQDETINILIAEIEGDLNNIIEAKSYLKNHELQSEIIGYVGNNTTSNP